jgi:toxin ParE1/3/4
MKIVWSRFAVKNLRDIYEYYAENAGPSIALKIRNGIFEEGKKISKYPSAAQIQESLSGLRQEHRYVLKGHYKIIYIIVDNEILITDIFDTRQHPSKMNSERKK